MPDSDRRPAGPPPTFLRPFAAVPRIASYHQAGAIEAARSDLERTVRRGEGFGVVVGPPGTGKTLLLLVLADRLRGDFDVALLAGARICTRRALWQSILAELGEPYRGLEEGDLRMAVVERVRTLAASASGLVLLLDEAHTLPERLLEEIRLLSGLPTPIPAVHVVLAGTLDLEERLASPKRESLVQRVVVRCALGRLDHAETAAYLRTQCAAASMRWEERFAEGCEDAIFTITDGVPRVVNQVCDHALRLADERCEAGGTLERVTPRLLQEAWRRIQQLPPTGSIGVGRTLPDHDGLDDESIPTPCAEWSLVGRGDAGVERTDGSDASPGSRAADTGPQTDAIVEFGSLDDDAWVRRDPATPTEPRRHQPEASSGASPARGDIPPSTPCRPEGAAEVTITNPAQDPWAGPDIELLFDPSSDPFEEMFESVEQIAGRVLVRGPDSFAARRRVVSDEGEWLARKLDALQADGEARRRTIAVEAAPPRDEPAIDSAAAPEITARVTVEDADEPDFGGVIEPDDRELLVIEEDDDRDCRSSDPLVFAVRPADYRGLFARLRSGG